jgi:replicative DNA helicase
MTPSPDITRSMPFSNDAEKGILSCFLHNPEPLLADAPDHIPPEAFYHAANRLMYEVMQQFRDEGRPIEYIALSQWLMDKGLMDKIGGQGALAELLDFIPTPTHYTYYRGLVRDKWIFRKGIQIGTEHVEKAYANQADKPDEWVDKFAADAVELQRQVQQGSTVRDGLDISRVHDEMVDTMYETGPSTGFPWLDKTLGGLIRTALTLFQGKRGIGKSAFTRRIAWHAACAGIPTDIYTVEMTREQYYRGICCIEGVNGNSFLQGSFTNAELEIMKRLKERGRSIPLRLHDDAKTVAEVINRMRASKLKRQMRLTVVDMPQRLIGDRKEGRERELSNIFLDLKNAGKDLDCTVLAPVHLNAELVSRGSEDIENHADHVVIMAKDKEKPSPLDRGQKILLKCTKNRYGPEGGRCLYWFVGKHVRFEEDGETELDIAPPKNARATR